MVRWHWANLRVYRQFTAVRSRLPFLRDHAFNFASRVPGERRADGQRRWEKTERDRDLARWPVRGYILLYKSIFPENGSPRNKIKLIMTNKKINYLRDSFIQKQIPSVLKLLFVKNHFQILQKWNKSPLYLPTLFQFFRLRVFALIYFTRQTTVNRIKRCKKKVWNWSVWLRDCRRVLAAGSVRRYADRCSHRGLRSRGVAMWRRENDRRV